MSLDTWSPAAGSDELTYYRTEDVTVSCAAPYVGHRTAAKTLHCLSSAPGHVDLPGDSRHGAMVEGQLFRWDDGQAAESLAEALAALPAGPVCTACAIRPAAGLCRVCRAAADRDENRETETENAA
jgi:hypothetical protein